MIQSFSELSLDKLQAHPKPILYLLFPHGIVSLGGWSWGSLITSRPSAGAAADVLLRMPIVRQLLGQFVLCSGSRKELKHQLMEKRTDICLYPGGVAELFLCNSHEETLYFDHRKGCIKLAMVQFVELHVWSSIDIVYTHMCVSDYGG